MGRYPPYHAKLAAVDVLAVEYQIGVLDAMVRTGGLRAARGIAVDATPYPGPHRWERAIMRLNQRVFNEVNRARVS